MDDQLLATMKIQLNEALKELQLIRSCVLGNGKAEDSILYRLHYLEKEYERERESRKNIWTWYGVPVTLTLLLNFLIFLLNLILDLITQRGTQVLLP